MQTCPQCKKGFITENEGIVSDGFTWLNGKQVTNWKKEINEFCSSAICDYNVRKKHPLSKKEIREMRLYK